MNVLLARLRGLGRPERLTVGPLALMANTGLTSVLGVLFWAAAARLYRPAELGEDAGLIAAMILLASFSELSLSQGIPRLLPQLERRRSAAVVGAYVATGGLAIVLAIGFVAIVPNVSPGFAFLKADNQLALILIGSVALWNVFALQDAVLIAVRRPLLVPLENGVFSGLKIILMAMFALYGRRHGVMLGWVLAMIVMLPPVNWFLFARLLRPLRQDTVHSTHLLPLTNRGRVARYLAGDYAGSVVSQGLMLLLPVLVLALLGSTASAYFYVAFTIAGALSMLALAVSTSLVVEGAHDEPRLASLAMHALVRWATLLVPGIVLLAFLAPLVLRPFGSDYAENATGLLRLLVAGSIPQSLVIVYLGTERVRGRAGRILLVQCLSLAVMLVGLMLFLPRGLNGVGIAWLTSWTLTALAILPGLMRLVRGKPPAKWRPEQAQDEPALSASGLENQPGVERQQHAE